MDTLILTKETRLYNGVKTISLTSGAGRDWGQEEKGTTEDEMALWHHQLDRHEFE